MKFTIRENKTHKELKGEFYNYIFHKESGYLASWGKTRDDDPLYSPYGPIIADIELSTICHGINNKVCDFCYKSNTPKGENMSLETFKIVLEKLPKTLTQIAFGIGSIDCCTDLEAILAYTRENGIVPNITINGDRMTPYYYDMLAKYCGAVAISRYSDKDICYNAVRQLTDRGMKQINIHALISEQTEKMLYETIEDTKTDSRLEKLNALVLLSLKKKGDRNNLAVLPVEKLEQIIKLSEEKGIKIGFDTCTAPKIIDYFEKQGTLTEQISFIDSCCSTRFSIYINHKGEFFPCSFTEGEVGWEQGLDLKASNDFYKDIWFNEKTITFREELLKTIKKYDCCHCPKFEV